MTMQLPAYNSVSPEGMSVLVVLIACGPRMNAEALADRYSKSCGKTIHPIAIRKQLGQLASSGYITIIPARQAAEYAVTPSGKLAGLEWYADIQPILKELNPTVT